MALRMLKHVCREAFKIVMQETLNNLIKGLPNWQDGPCNDRNVSKPGRVDLGRL